MLALVVLFGTMIPARAYAQIGLPADYISDLVYGAGAAGPIVSSHAGAVFMMYATASGATRVGRVDATSGAVTTVYEAAPWSKAEWLVGGPGETFFLVVDGTLLQIASDGTATTWSAGPLPGAPMRYSHDGRMIGTSPDAKSVIELHPDGSSTVLLSGFTMVYDLVVTSDDTIYIADFPAEKLVELSPDGSSRVVSAIAPDNTNLALDADDNLYLNNAAVGFNRVDVETGVLTPVYAPNAPCRAIASPAVVAFDAAGRALFFSWVDHQITWADPSSGEGGRVLEPVWANTPAADVGPDGALYVGVDGCGAITPATVRRVAPDGSSSIVASGLVGSIRGLAITDTGGVFVASSTETSGGLYYAPEGDTTLSLVPDTENLDIGSLASYSSGEEVLAYLGPESDGVRLSRFSDHGPDGEYTVTMPEPVAEFTIDIGPNGAVYAQASEAARYFTGPVVQRWLLELDLEDETYEVVFRHDREGCCPFDSFGVDYAGDLWWVLNPDFVVYRVDPDATADVFATNTPVDAGYVNRNADGDIYINSPEGVYRVWQASLSDRITLVERTLDQLVTHHALSKGRGQALRVLLHASALAAERDDTRVASQLVDSFLRLLNDFVRLGFLDEEPADYVISRVEELVLPHLSP